MTIVHSNLKGGFMVFNTTFNNNISVILWRGTDTCQNVLIIKTDTEQSCQLLYISRNDLQKFGKY